MNESELNRENPADTVRAKLQEALGSSYTLERELGGGGMSRVFLAHDTSLGRPVVVKLLLPELAAGVSVARFRREISLASRLQHPNIVPVLGAGDAAGLPYFTMPFVKGESLRALLDRQPRLDIAAAIRILRDVASGLQCAHSDGVVHRDIKPDNILLSSGGAMVTDFGVAKALSSARITEPGALVSTVTAVGTSLGTPAYMAPEQASADPDTDHRADIYSFGVTAFEILAGCLPFKCATQRAALTAHLTEQPPPLERERPDAPAALSSLIARCLEKDPSDRPQNAAEVVRELEDLAMSSYRKPASGRVWTRPWRSRAALLAGVAAATLLIAAGFRFGVLSGKAGAPDEPIRLAVLPFRTEGLNEERYFADGLAEAIGNRLARIKGLAVVDSRTLSASGDMSRPLTETGRELEVAYVLTGTVRWASGEGGARRAQVMPSLVRVADGTTAWAPDPYVVTPTDVFEVQTRIATSVAEALDVALAATERAALSERPTDNPRAYDEFLRGADFFRRARDENLDPGLLRSALDSYERAVSLDQRFALAYAKLAEVAFWWASLDPSDETRTARFTDALDKAERLDPSLPELRAARSLQLDH